MHPSHDASSAAGNGQSFVPYSVQRSVRTPSQHKTGCGSLRLLQIVAAALLFAGVLFWAQSSRDPFVQHHDSKVMKGKLKGMPKIKRIIQRRSLASEDAKARHVRNKELNLEQLEHAGFDPEAASYEDGIEPENVGFDVDYPGTEEHADSHMAADAEHSHDHVQHDHEGRPAHSGSHVSGDKMLHKDEHVTQQHGHPHHEHSHDRHGSSHAGGRGGWKSGSQDADKDEERQHKIKVRARLVEMFPHLDSNNDGWVDRAEMTAWHEDNGRNSSARRAKREFTWADTNKDGQVTLAEYLAELLPDRFTGNESLAVVEASPVWIEDENAWIRHNKVMFGLADVDHSGSLGEMEHFAFSHPEDSDSAALHALLRAQDIVDRDRNGDKKLDFSEFHDQVFFTVNEWEHPEGETDTEDEAAAKRRFGELDVNKDGFLDAEELKPIFHWLHPREQDYARIQAVHQVQAADNNGDGKLTLNEMLSNPFVFYSSGIIEDEDHEDGLHDEF